MKKLFCLFLVLMLVFCLTSCTKTDYGRLYSKYLQEEIIPKAGIKNRDVPEVDMYAMSWGEYAPLPGLAFAITEDLNEDGAPELITGEEIVSDDFFGDAKSSVLLIKAYTVSDGKVVLLDKTATPQLLPLFSFVDITLKDKNIIVSGIGAWAGDPPFNNHYIIRLDGNSFVQDTISSLDIYTWGGYDNMKEDEKKNIDTTLQNLQDFGFGYEKVDDLIGKYDPSAERIAFYSLFGKDGRSSEYFAGSEIPGKGFYDYTKSGAAIK